MAYTDIFPNLKLQKFILAVYEFIFKAQEKFNLMYMSIFFQMTFIYFLLLSFPRWIKLYND